jgi:ADP-dependent NAD(P)H-hydrate dehydratase / NAD(P)H-hydrate epimerase
MNINQILKLMDRKKNSKSPENGRVLIIGGSENNVGGITLAGLAALRAGCDVVTIAAPEKVAWTVNRTSPDLIAHKIKNQWTVKLAKEMVKVAERYEVVLIGNGITRKAEKFCNYFIKKTSRIKVIDSDALKGLSFKDFKNSIITPNEQEMEMMLSASGKDFLLPKLRESSAKEKAEILQGNLRYFLQNNNILVVKGPTDLIISKNRIALNRTGNQGMTKNGTGDILAGLAVGFLAKSGELYKSATAASFINGYVGDLILKKKKGYSFIASDILADLEKINKLAKGKKTDEKVVKKKSKKRK